MSAADDASAEAYLARRWAHTRAFLDRCITAIVAGETEIQADYNELNDLRLMDPAEVDHYAALHLPHALWGTPLRVNAGPRHMVTLLLTPDDGT